MIKKTNRPKYGGFSIGSSRLTNAFIDVLLSKNVKKGKIWLFDSSAKLIVKYVLYRILFGVLKLPNPCI